MYEEYTRRVAAVKAVAENIIQLWAELGTPQAQTDSAIVKYYRDAPEQLGLHEEDIARLRGKRDKLVEEKKNRERRLRDLKCAVETLWEKLEIDERERKAFLNGNRGCGIRQINEFEDELARLNELKRQNLHLFVEDARFKLQELWDALYLSEDEMLEFTPAFSDVYSDALLEAHEREIARLEVLKEQRAPTLALVDKHRSLVHDRDELAASSQDASRLMMRGQKGERRDPGKLLREEKMRKRIAKELPKVTAELRKALETWEDEFGRPFLVHGERYLDCIELDETKAAPGPRSKTPAPTPTPASTKNNAALNRAKSVGHLNAPKSTGKTPNAGTATRPTRAQSTRTAPTNLNNLNNRGSPTRIPAARAPLSSLKNGNNSPERPRPESRAEAPSRLGSSLMMRAPPPKMRELLPPPELETPLNQYRSAGFSSSIVRHVEPEDVYDDRDRYSSEENIRPMSRDYYSSSQSSDHHRPHHPPPGYPCGTSAYPQQQQKAPSAPVRQISNTSNTSTVVTGSENWETYDDNSEPEEDASDTYYAKVRAARAGGGGGGGGGIGGGGLVPMKLRQQQQQYHPQQSLRGIPPSYAAGGGVMVDQEGNRIMSGSEWTDEDAF